MSNTDVQLLTGSLFHDLVEQAGRTARRRLNYNFHLRADDNPHRFLNVFLEGSYVRPHRHKDPPKSEAFLVLEGRMALFVRRPRRRGAEFGDRQRPA